MTDLATFAIRRGKIRLRNGAEVRVLDQASMRKPESAVLRGELVEKAKYFADNWPDLGGFVVFVWDSRGYWSEAHRVGVNSAYASVMIPTLVSEGLREDLAINSAVHWINKQIRGDDPCSS